MDDLFGFAEVENDNSLKDIVDAPTAQNEIKVDKNHDLQAETSYNEAHSITDFIDIVKKKKSNLYSEWVLEHELEIDHYYPVIRDLYEAFIGGRKHHTYRFSAPLGSGKEVCIYEFLFRIFIPDYHCNPHKYINSDIILRILNNSHPDFLLIESDDKVTLSKTHKKNITVDNVQKIQRFIYQRSYESEYQVVIINALDNLNLNSMNALLKAIEEPTDKCIFLLANHNKYNILDTILSRTFGVNLSLFPKQIKKEIICNQSKKKYQNIDLDLLLDRMELSHGMILVIIDHGFVQKYKDIIANLFQIIESKKKISIYQIIGKNIIDNDYIELMIIAVKLFLTTSIHLFYGIKYEFLVNEEAVISGFLQTHNVEQILNFISRISVLEEENSLLNLDNKIVLIEIIGMLL